MTSSFPVPAPPRRTQAQRIVDLTRERDRMSRELIQIKKLLGKIRDSVFNVDWGNDQQLDAVRQALLDDWDTATPPGKIFDLIRAHDSSGVSGDGRVAEGVEFENGKVAMCWLGAMASVNLYDSIDHVRAIHGHGGSTEVVYR